MQYRGNVPPEACSDTKWHSAACSLTCRLITGIWGGARYLWGGQVGERIALMGSARLSTCSVVPPAREK